MIAAVKAYLQAQLEAAGVPAARITGDPERGGREWPPPQVPYAELLADPEQLTREGRLSDRTYDPVTMQATLWRRRFRRVLPIRVRLVHADEAALDALVTTFLAGLAASFRDGSQSITVRPSQATWGRWNERPSDREQVTLRIECRGGVYTSDAAGTVQQVNVPANPAFN